MAALPDVYKRQVITCQNDGAKPNDIENILSSKGGMLFLTVLINGNGGNIQYLSLIHISAVKTLPG